MCLGIPGKILEIYHKNGLLMGKVDFGGVGREICLEYIPEANCGDYTIIHAGFAISLLDEEQALADLDLINQIASLEDQPISPK